MLFNLFLCLVGFILLSFSADKLVEGASNLAKKLGVSPMVIGLTVVAFGTSLPEMVISVNASLKGNPEISVGNAVGSNIMNAALILGIAALINPITCQKSVIRREVPIMIGSVALLWYMASTGGVISQTEGIILLILFVAYNLLSLKWANAEKSQKSKVSEDNDKKQDEEKNETSSIVSVLFILLGLVGLIAGSEALVRGATAIAKSIGVSDEIIALTLIAIGTSLPELATAIVASRKKQSDIILGNVVGSNIFNVLGIVGVAAVVCSFNSPPTTSVLAISPNMVGIHIPIMLIVSLGVLPIMSTGLKIVRAEGALLFLAYLIYNVVIFQTSVGKPHKEADNKKLIKKKIERVLPAASITQPINLPSKGQ